MLVQFLRSAKIHAVSDGVLADKVITARSCKDFQKKLRLQDFVLHVGSSLPVTVICIRACRCFLSFFFHSEINHVTLASSR